MSATTCEPMEEQKTYTTFEPAADTTTSMRNLFASQTGQALVTLGTVFQHVPPFNEHIDGHTAQLLISIGRKLKSAK